MLAEQHIRASDSLLGTAGQLGCRLALLWLLWCQSLLSEWAQCSVLVAEGRNASPSVSRHPPTNSSASHDGGLGSLLRSAWGHTVFHG